MPTKLQKEKPGEAAQEAAESLLTAENFEKELKALAAKARQQTPFKSLMRQVTVTIRAATILMYAAAYSNISLLTMSPVYGLIPASLWHYQLVVTACFIGWSGNLWLKRRLPKRPVFLLPILACYIPMIQYVLFQLSGNLGAVYGPVLTELLTFIPLLILSISSVALILEELNLGALGKHIEDAGPGVGSYLFFRVAEYFSKILMQKTMGTNFFGTRIGLQVLLGGLYTILAPSRLCFFALPGLYHLAFYNRHFQTPWADFGLNQELSKTHGFTLLDRHDSVTGYLSVLESTRDEFRVMRCDHSLLGGEWLQDSSGAVKEPIYGVFAMLEAVRLVEVHESIPDNKAAALVVGLGIGTTPSALIAHGINTTIVEIDPIVHEYATRYFALPTNHTPIIADAVKHLGSLARTEQKYDYVVHDVFTGGAEPVELFTQEFLQDLRDVLKPSGAIAINYAGDLTLPSARLIVRTIKSVFPSCRIYRENAPPSEEVIAVEKRDFTNMVVFCTKKGNPISFRQPKEADYLGSQARKVFLVPHHEINANVFAEQEGDGPVLSRTDTARLTEWQQISAIGHWNVMRTVLPTGLWEAW